MYNVKYRYYYDKTRPTFLQNVNIIKSTKREKAVGFFQIFIFIITFKKKNDKLFHVMYIFDYIGVDFLLK